MLYKRTPSTTSLSGDEDDDEQTKYMLYGPSSHKATFAIAPANWTSPSGPPSSQSNSPMSSIPPEILIHILKHLQSTRDIYHTLQVSRTWCECSVELLWHKPTFNKLEPLLKLTRLLASPRQTFTYCNFIRRLNFLSIGKDLTDDTFTVLAKCDRLERLTLVGCNALSSDTLNQVLPSFPNLVAIDLTGVENTTNAAIVGLASVAKRLQGINLGGCKEVGDDGVLALASNCPLLRRVKLSGLETLTDKPVSALAKACPLLLEIDLNGCKLITDTAIRDIWTFSTHMREMKLSHCPELTDAAFPAPLRRDKVPQTDTPNPFPSSSKQDGDELPPLVIPRTFDHLRMLDLTACSQVTDDAIEGIISYAPKIRNLVLNKCSLLTDRSVENICRLGRHLHYLHLGHTAKITDKSVRTLARSCTRLRYVDFANCVLLTDMAVFELSALPKLRRVGLVRKLHKLTHLSLTGVPAFRQPELQQFCREPPSDFSTTQQSAFCVYSGKGVSQLRAFLTELFDRITEMNGTDDTEYEDEEYDPDVYHEDTPEPEVPGDDEEEFITQRIITPTAARDFIHPRVSVALRPASADSTTEPNLANPQLVARPSAVPSAAPRRIGGPPSAGFRTLADVFPVVETTNSPPPSDVASNMSAGTSRSNGAGFFRNYRDGNPTTSARNSGVMTPDLNYAEIGHGRGVQSGASGQNHQMRRSQAHPPQHRVPFVEPERQASPPSNGTPPGSASASESRNLPVLSQTHPEVDWTYRETGSPIGESSGSSSRELHDSVHSALSGTTADPRGRSVKRSLRNTLNAAEHYASSFLFGRSSARMQEDGAGPSTSPTTSTNNTVSRGQ
ncbi:SCF ubiquitin ligase complex subunit [Marasmius sp. AFHP31]|nr:SCF ubiquitin ligase complex subunit [Marasmius sp. AFHP31]